MHGRISVTSLTGGKGRLTGSVSLLPGVHYQTGELQLWAAKVGSTGALRYVDQRQLTRGSNSRTFSFTLPKGQWKVQLHYVNSGVLATALTGVHTRTVR